MPASIAHTAESWKIKENSSFIPFYWTLSEQAKATPSFVNQVVIAIKFLNALGPFRFSYQAVEQSTVNQRLIHIDIHPNDCFASPGRQESNYIKCNGFLYGAGSIFHELQHILGRFHEHKRIDATPIEILSNDSQYVTANFSSLAPYDLFSNMHYGLNAVLQLRDKKTVLSYLYEQGLDREAVDLIWDLRSEIGNKYLISRFDMTQLFRLAYVINPTSIQSIKQIPLCGLIPGESYDSRKLQRFLQLFTNPSYAKLGDKILAQKSMEIRTWRGQCAEINLVKLFEIPAFIPVRCRPMVDLPVGVMQSNCSIFLQEDAPGFFIRREVEFFTTVKNMTAFARVNWGQFPSLLRKKTEICTMIPRENNATHHPFSLEYPEYTESISSYQIISFLNSSSYSALIIFLPGMINGAFLSALQTIRDTYCLGPKLSFILALSPFVLNGIASLLSGKEFIDRAQATKAFSAVLPLIDENGLIYESYLLEMLNQEEIAYLNLLPYLVNLLSAAVLTGLTSNTLPHYRIFESILPPTLSIFFSTLFTARDSISLLRAGIGSTAYLLANSIGYASCTLLYRRYCASVPAKNPVQETIFEQEAAAFQTEPLTQTSDNGESLSVSKAFTEARRTVTRGSFCTAFRNFFFSSKNESLENDNTFEPIATNHFC